MIEKSVEIMKKEILFGIFILGLLIITGCTDSPQFEREGSLEEYLNVNYPSEKFETISLDEKKVDKKSNHCNYTGVEKTYTIKSLDSSIVFTLKDVCTYDLYGDVYEVENDYLTKANEKFLNDNINTKMKLYENNYYVIAEFEIKNYNTKEEMENDIWNIVTQFKTKYPYKNQNILEASSVRVINYEDVSKSLKISKINSMDDINELVDESLRQSSI